MPKRNRKYVPGLTVQQIKHAEQRVINRGGGHKEMDKEAAATTQKQRNRNVSRGIGDKKGNARTYGGRSPIVRSSATVAHRNQRNAKTGIRTEKPNGVKPGSRVRKKG